MERQLGVERVDDAAGLEVVDDGARLGRVDLLRVERRRELPRERRATARRCRDEHDREESRADGEAKKAAHGA